MSNVRLSLSRVEQHLILDLLSSPARPDLRDAKGNPRGMSRAEAARTMALVDALGGETWDAAVDEVRRAARAAFRAVGPDGKPVACPSCVARGKTVAVEVAVQEYITELGHSDDEQTFALTDRQADDLVDILDEVSRANVIPPRGARVWSRIFAKVDARKAAAGT